MSQASITRYLYLSRLSKPIHHRALYRTIRSQRFVRVVEIGVNDGERAKSIISVALMACGEADIRYTGIDLFEASEARDAGMSLKEAHRMLHDLSTQVRLVPGDSAAALSRCANELRGTDLVVISANYLDSIRSAWHFLPRMLHKDSQVWLESPAAGGRLRYEVLSPADVRTRYQNRGKKAA